MELTHSILKIIVSFVVICCFLNLICFSFNGSAVPSGAHTALGGVREAIVVSPSSFYIGKALASMKTRTGTSWSHEVTVGGLSHGESSRRRRLQKGLHSPTLQIGTRGCSGLSWPTVRHLKQPGMEILGLTEIKKSGTETLHSCTLNRPNKGIDSRVRRSYCPHAADWLSCKREARVTEYRSAEPGPAIKPLLYLRLHST